MIVIHLHARPLLIHQLAVAQAFRNSIIDLGIGNVTLKVVVSVFNCS